MGLVSELHGLGTQAPWAWYSSSTALVAQLITSPVAPAALPKSQGACRLLSTRSTKHCTQDIDFTSHRELDSRHSALNGRGFALTRSCRVGPGPDTQLLRVRRAAPQWVFHPVALNRLAGRRLLGVLPRRCGASCGGLPAPAPPRPHSQGVAATRCFLFCHSLF